MNMLLNPKGDLHNSSSSVFLFHGLSFIFPANECQKTRNEEGNQMLHPLTAKSSEKTPISLANNEQRWITMSDLPIYLRECVNPDFFEH